MLLLVLFILAISLGFALSVALIQVLWEPCATLGRLLSDWLREKFSQK